MHRVIDGRLVRTISLIKVFRNEKESMVNRRRWIVSSRHGGVVRKRVASLARNGYELLGFREWIISKSMVRSWNSREWEGSCSANLVYTWSSDSPRRIILAASFLSQSGKSWVI